jgi:chromosome condensin MukBEF MukE localization factor
LHHAPICAPTVQIANASLPTPSASLTGIKHGLGLLELTNFTFFYKFGEKLTEALTRYSLLPFRSGESFFVFAARAPGGAAAAIDTQDEATSRQLHAQRNVKE